MDIDSKLEDRVAALEAQVLPRLMTPAQVCEYAGISERQFYNFKERGDGPPSIHLGSRTVRYDIEDVRAWLNTKKIGAGK